MQKKALLVLSLREGSVVATLVGKKLDVLSECQQEIKTIHPKPGYVEYDPLEISYAVRSSIHQVLQKSHFNPQNIEGIGLTAFRQSVLAWDRETGQPFYHVISPRDIRNKLTLKVFASKPAGKEIESLLGRAIDPQFPLFKVKWLHDNVPDFAKSCKNKNALVGTVDSWILYNLTGKDHHKTDFSQATQTGWMTKSGEWDSFLVRESGIGKEALPEIFASGTNFGVTKGFVPLPDGIPILASLELESAGFWGAECFHTGEGCLRFGSERHFLVNSGALALENCSFTPTTLSLREGPVQAFEKYGLSTASISPWMQALRASELAPIATPITHESIGNVKMIPTFFEPLSLAVPNAYAYSVTGLSATTTPEQLLQAAYASLVFQVKRDVLELESKGLRLKELRVEGDLANQDLVLQFLADQVQFPVLRFRSKSLSITGTAFLVGLGAGFFEGKVEFMKHNKVEKTFVPQVDPLTSYTLYQGWAESYEETRVASVKSANFLS